MRWQLVRYCDDRLIDNLRIGDPFLDMLPSRLDFVQVVTDSKSDVEQFLLSALEILDKSMPAELIRL